MNPASLIFPAFTRYTTIADFSLSLKFVIISFFLFCANNSTLPGWSRLDPMNDAWRSIARLGLDGKHCVDWCRSPIARLAAQYNCFLHSLFSKSFEGKHPILQRNLLANERKAHRYYISVRSVTFCTIVSTNSPYQHITSTITPAHQHIISTPAHQHITSTPAQYQMW